MKFTIRLERLRFFSRIGLFPQEREVGNEFEVDVCFSIDAAQFEVEEIGSTVSYADVYELISAVMNTEWKLLESVAHTLLTSIKEKRPRVFGVSVKVTKLAPPISGIMGVCSVQCADD